MQDITTEIICAVFRLSTGYVYKVCWDLGVEEQTQGASKDPKNYLNMPMENATHGPNFLS